MLLIDDLLERQLAMRHPLEPIDYYYHVRDTYEHGNFHKLQLFIVSNGQEIPFKPIHYEFVKQDSIINEINEELKRVYAVSNYRENQMYVGRCVLCNKIHMVYGSKKALNKKCKSCLNKNIKEVAENYKPKKKNTKIYVYLMRSNLTGYLKIGISGNPKKRKRTLETAQGGKIDIINMFLGDQEIESLLHKRFSKYREEGEWFQYNENIIESFNDVALTIKEE